MEDINLGRTGPPPLEPIATQARVKGIKSTAGIPMVTLTMLTALGSCTYFFEPEVAIKIAEGMKQEAFRAPLAPTPGAEGAPGLN